MRGDKMEKASEYHIPVLFKETLDNLIVNKDGIYVDCTLGGGGHSEGILERLSEKGKLICIDQDDSAIAFAKERLKKYEGKFEIYKDNFNIDSLLLNYYRYPNQIKLQDAENPESDFANIEIEWDDKSLDDIISIMVANLDINENNPRFQLNTLRTQK